MGTRLSESQKCLLSFRIRWPHPQQFILDRFHLDLRISFGSHRSLLFMLNHLLQPSSMQTRLYDQESFPLERTAHPLSSHVTTSISGCILPAWRRSNIQAKNRQQTARLQSKRIEGETGKRQKDESRHRTESSNQNDWQERVRQRTDKQSNKQTSRGLGYYVEVQSIYEDRQTCNSSTYHTVSLSTMDSVIVRHDGVAQTDTDLLYPILIKKQHTTVNSPILVLSDSSSTTIYVSYWQCHSQCLLYSNTRALADQQEQ